MQNMRDGAAALYIYIVTDFMQKHKDYFTRSKRTAASVLRQPFASQIMLSFQQAGASIPIILTSVGATFARPNAPVFSSHLLSGS